VTVGIIFVQSGNIFFLNAESPGLEIHVATLGNDLEWFYALLYLPSYCHVLIVMWINEITK